jgi:hypothetical protein
LIKKRDQKNIVVQNEREGHLQWKAKTINFSLNQYKFEFQDEVYNCSTSGIFILSLIVGLVGGIYGIGGGAIIAPFLVAIYRLPVYAIAGATLVGTFVTSIFGVLFYQLIAPFYETSSMTVSPDWALGALFGFGGLFGIYLGAKVQRFVQVKWLKLLLGLIILFVATLYILGYFL